MSFRLTLLLVALAFTSKCFAETFKCTLPDGRTSYQQSPCPGQGQAIATPSSNFGGRQEAFESSPALQDLQKKIKAISERSKQRAVLTQKGTKCDAFPGGSPERSACVDQWLCELDAFDSEAVDVKACLLSRAQKRSEALRAAEEERAERERRAKRPEPRLGMSTVDAQDSRWGAPDEVRTSQDLRGSWEFWHYRRLRNATLVFKNDVLIQIDR